MAKTTTKKPTRIAGSDFTDHLLAMLGLCNTKVILNTPLSGQEKTDLLQKCIDLYRAKSNYQQIYNDCHNLINNILSKYNYQPRTPGKSHNSNAMQNLPYEMKVLIYIMAYRAFELYDNATSKKGLVKPTQDGVLNFLSTPVNSTTSKCYKLSRKTFTYFGISPKVFYNINNYKQIQLPSKYAGAKTGYLGYALNYLVSYAGIIDNYIDLFGGSASAFMAVMKTNNIDYYINEIEFFIVNYYHVISNKKLYNGYIKELFNVRDELKQILSSGNAVYAVERGKYFFNHCDKIRKDWQEKYPLSNYDQLINENIIQSPNFQQYQLETDSDKVDAAVAYTYIHSFQVTGGKNEVGALNLKSLEKFCNTVNKLEYDKFHAHMARLEHIYNSDMLDDEFLINYFTNKAPKKYKDIEKLANAIRNGSTPETISEQQKKLLRLLGKDSTGKPRLFRTLFYSDSPYLNTKGYNEDKDNIDNSQMKALIYKLVNASKKGSHFIFSCRASKSIEENTFFKLDAFTDLRNPVRSDGNVVLDTQVIHDYEKILFNGNGTRTIVEAKSSMNKIIELLEQNNAIYHNVFKEFEKYSKSFYVLVCIDTSRSGKDEHGENRIPDLKVLLHSMQTTEVFITDYDFVVPLKYKNPITGKLYAFKKYTISKFCEILDDCMFKSNIPYKVVKKSGGYSFEIDTKNK
ncbi:hypothetical protein IMSAGC007_00118 [Lachnospiraceae bacterium]|nr:hypothetical protein IMSAGC007_00118 [Lachnospiraceae bacterium]